MEQQQAVATIETQFQTAALTHIEWSAALIITSQTDLEAAAERLRAIKALRDEAEKHHRPIIQSAHGTWKLALAALAKIDDPLAQAEKFAKTAIGGYVMAEEKRLREEQLQIERELEQQRAIEVEAEIVAAESNGASHVEVAAIIEQAALEPVFVPQVERPKTAGVSTSKRYSGVVFRPAAFIGWCVQNQMFGMLEIKQSALDAYIRAQQGACKIPGVTVQVTGAVAVRR